MVKVSLVPRVNFKMRLGKFPKTRYIELFIHIFWIFKVFSSFISFGQSGMMLSRLLTLLSHSQCWDYRCVPHFPLSPMQTTLIFLWLYSEVESRLRALARSKGESHDHAKHRSIPGGTDWFSVVWFLTLQHVYYYNLNEFIWQKCLSLKPCQEKCNFYWVTLGRLFKFLCLWVFAYMHICVLLAHIYIYVHY